MLFDIPIPRLFYLTILRSLCFHYTGMSTRGLTCVIKDGLFEVAQYGHHDHYLDGEGHKIAQWIRANRDPDSLKHFKNQIDKLKIIEDEPQKPGGVAILEYIQKELNPTIYFNLVFAADSLLCEYAYVLNLDTEELEIFKGFNRYPLNSTERFFFLQAGLPEAGLPEERVVELSGKEPQFYPVKHLKTFKFAELKYNSIDELAKTTVGRTLRND